MFLLVRRQIFFFQSNLAYRTSEKSRLALIIHFFFKEELEPHERCIRKILEQKGRVVQIVYRLENSSDDVIEGFEEDDLEFDELGVDATSSFDQDDEGSALLEAVRSAWVRLQLGNMKKNYLN